MLEEAKGVAADLVEEVTGRPVNVGQGGGRRARATRARTQRILRELEGIANNPAVPEAQRDAATRLHGEIEDLNNEARAAEIERARAAGAPKTAERAAERAAGGRHEMSAKAEHTAAKLEGKGAGASVKTTTATTSATTAGAKAESAVAEAASEVKAVTRVSRVGSGLAKFGSMGFHFLMPGPLDAIALMVQFAGSYAEAQEAIRNRNTRSGFAIGLSAFVLGRSHRAVRKHLARKFVLDRDVHTQVVGAVGIAERAHNDGLDSGFKYGELLSDDAKDALRDFGFSAMAAQGRLPRDRNELFSAEGVWRLAAAIRPIVDQIFEAMRAEAERQEQEERRKMHRESGHIGMKV